MGEPSVLWRTSAWAMPSSAHLREDERLATVEMKINYVAAVSSGVLTAEAKLVNRTRNLAVLESRVECGGKLVAKAMGTFYISRKASREIVKPCASATRRWH